MNRSINILSAAILCIGAVASVWPSTLPNVSSGTNWKRATGSINNCVLSMMISQLADQSKVTGTGVPVEFYAAVLSQDPNGWVAGVLNVRATFAGIGEAQIYPIEGESEVLDEFGRSFRFDSTPLQGSVSGTSFATTLTVRFVFARAIPTFPYLETVYADRDLTVTPKAFNVAAVTATEENIYGIAPAGWQSMNELPSQYTWASVSADMATAARTKLATANHALLDGDFHTYQELVLSQAEVAPILADSGLTQAQKDAAIRQLQLGKLLGKSTVHFCSSHGATGGFFAEPHPLGPGEDPPMDPLVPVDWASVARTTGSHISAPYRPLANRFVFMYSCQCGSSGSALLGAYHIGYQNTAAFGFPGVVFSTLVSGNTSSTVPYNDSNGDLIMTDKLTEHVNKLLGDLAQGSKSVDAMDPTNNAHPPRKFSHGANGINYAARMDMLRFGCPDARLRKVFRASSETDAAVKQFGDWGLLVKELLAVPMMEEEQP